MTLKYLNVSQESYITKVMLAANIDKPFSQCGVAEMVTKIWSVIEWSVAKLVSGLYMVLK